MILPRTTWFNESCARNPDVTNIFVIFQHGSLGLSLPLGIIALVCIIKAAPWETKSFKFILVTYQISLIAVDLLLTVLIVPDFLFPILGGYPLGVLRWTNVSSLVQLVLACGTLLVMFATLAHMFLHRHQMAMPPGSKRRLSKRFRFLVTISLYLFPQGGLLFCYQLVPPDFTAVKITVASEESCYPIELFFDGTVVVDRNTATIIAALITFMLTGSILFIGSIVFDTFRTLRHSSNHMSQRGQCTIIRSLRTLILQCLIPHLFALVPISLYMVITFIDLHNQVMVQAATALLSFHSTVSTLAMIFLNSGYRKYVFRLGPKTSNVTRIAPVTRNK